MKIIDTISGKTIGTVITNHSMAIEDACDLCGIEYMVTEEDFNDGEKYDITNLDLVYDED